MFIYFSCQSVEPRYLGHTSSSLGGAANWLVKKSTSGGLPECTNGHHSLWLCRGFCRNYNAQKRRPANAGGTLRMLAGRLGHARHDGRAVREFYCHAPGSAGGGFTANASLGVRLLLLGFRVILY
jgi:hypothetical protein